MTKLAINDTRKKTNREAKQNGKTFNKDYKKVRIHKNTVQNISLNIFNFAESNRMHELYFVCFFGSIVASC